VGGSLLKIMRLSLISEMQNRDEKRISERTKKSEGR